MYCIATSFHILTPWGGSCPAPFIPRVLTGLYQVLEPPQHARAEELSADAVTTRSQAGQDSEAT